MAISDSDLTVTIGVKAADADNLASPGSEKCMASKQSSFVERDVEKSRAVKVAEHLSSTADKKKHANDYWTTTLKDVAPLDLRIDKKHVEVHKQGCANSVSLSLSGQELQFSESRLDGLVLVLLASWTALLARYCRVEDLCVGIGAMGKSKPSLLSFLRGNIIPLACSVLPGLGTTNGNGDNPSRSANELWGSVGTRSIFYEMNLLQAEGAAKNISEWVNPHTMLGVLEDKLLELEQHARDFSPESVAKKAGQNLVDMMHPFFQAMFVWDDGKLDMNAKQRKRALHPYGDQTSPCPLQLRFVMTQSGMRARIIYLEDFFHPESVEHMAHQLQVLFCTALEDASLPLDLIPMMQDKERALVVGDWSDATQNTNYPREKCVHHLFEEQVAKAPDHIALIYRDSSITYENFDAVCNSLASDLRSVGCQRESMVGLLFNRGVEMMVAVYGTLKAGGAYVPMDPHYPQDRIRSIMSDISPPAMLSTQDLVHKLPADWPKDKVIMVDDTVLRFQATASRSKIQPLDWWAPGGANPIYVFFTSGTTGKPKGVVVEHKGLVHRTLWLQDEYGMKPTERTALKHGYTFGLSEWEIFWPICVGGSLVLMEPEGEKHPDYVFHLTQKQGITHMFFVPSMLRMLLEYIELEGIDVSNFPLRLVVTCGEALVLELVQKFFQLLPTAQIHNLYGPTEGEMTLWKCPKGVQIPYVPIGKPMPGCKTYVTDRSCEPCAINVPGELSFGGPFIAREYLGLPELTAEKFVSDKISAESGERLYLTGDLATWKTDGNLEFNGRIDNQVKLRGFRIELGEIEAVLRGYGLQQAVVLLLGSGGAQMLVAYCAPAEEGDAALIRSECVKKLPPYMVPSVVAPLKSMPLTDRGKIDKKSLPPPPQPGGAGDSQDVATVAPRTPIEIRIRDIWAESLKVGADSLSIETDFQSAGGNSLLAGGITSKIRKAFPRAQIPGTAMYTHSTIVKLGQLVTEKLALAGPEEEEEVIMQADQRYKGMSGRRPVALFLQLIGLTLISTSEMLDLPLYVLGLWIYYTYGFWVFCLTLPIVDVVSDTFMLLFVAFVKFCMFPTRMKPGRYPVYSIYYFRWWLVHQLMTLVFAKTVIHITATPLVNFCYWLAGAEIGKGVLLEEVYGLTCPELVKIGDYTHLEPRVNIHNHAIVDGELILERVEIGAYCYVAANAVITPGTVLGDGSSVGPFACTNGFRSGQSKAIPEITIIPPLYRKQPRIVWWIPYVGIPWIVVLSTLPHVPAAYLLFELYDVLSEAIEDEYLAIYSWCFISVYIMVHLSDMLYVILCVLQKRFIIGKFTPGPRQDASDWTEFCRWLQHVAVASNPSFIDTLEPFTNTELLRWVFALMGCKFGRRVQTDLFWTREHDLVTISDYVVFGFNVALNVSDHVESRPILLEPNSNVLDNCCLMPGCHVGERAILGSNTLGAKSSYFPPNSTSTGNKQGRAVFLRFNTTGASAGANAEEKKFELLALKRVDSPFYWWSFNIGLMISALVLAPFLSGIVYVCLAAIYVMVSVLELNIWQVILLSPAISIGLDLLVCLLEIITKWLLVGRFREKNYAFMGWFHFKWMLLMMINRSAAVETLPGTVFYNWFYRANGAKVGTNVCNFGFTLEYDMFSAGNYACIGEDCDNTCHTVERMVLKVAPVRVGDYAAMCSKSCVMPGATMQTGALLLDDSQVLKGDVVPENECWSGQPAEQISHTHYRGRSGYRHVRFVPTKLRRYASFFEVPKSSVSHVALRHRQSEITYDNSQVQHLQHKGLWSVVVSFSAPVIVTEYAFTTAEADPGNDPVRWQLQGTNDDKLQSWELLDERTTDFASPLSRFSPVYCQIGAWPRKDSVTDWPSKSWTTLRRRGFKILLLLLLLAIIVTVVVLLVNLDKLANVQVVDRAQGGRGPPGRVTQRGRKPWIKAGQGPGGAVGGQRGPLGGQGGPLGGLGRGRQGPAAAAVAGARVGVSTDG